MLSRANETRLVGLKFTGLCPKELIKKNSILKLLKKGKGSFRGLNHWDFGFCRFSNSMGAFDFGGCL